MGEHAWACLLERASAHLDELAAWTGVLGALGGDLFSESDCTTLYLCSKQNNSSIVLLVQLSNDMCTNHNNLI